MSNIQYQAMLFVCGINWLCNNFISLNIFFFFSYSYCSLPFYHLEHKVIIVGLDNAGKTTILYQL